jgi:hypothetical protein
MTSSTFTTSAPVRSVVLALMSACTWAVGLRHQLKTYTWTEDECEAEGLPLGTSEVCAYAFPMAGAQWWRLDAWDDGDCFHLNVLCWSVEVHHEPRQVAPAAA